MPGFCYNQGLVKGEKLRNHDFYFRHGDSTSTASQLSSSASQKVRILTKFRSFYKTFVAIVGIKIIHLKVLKLCLSKWTESQH